MADSKAWQAFDSRIINGFDAPINRYPYTVSLQDEGGHYCGGSVIAPDLVLSAAHCPSYLYSDVVVNPHNVDDPREGTETFGIVTYAIHPLYMTLSRNSPDHDIRIIKLDGFTSQPIVRLNTDNMLPESGSELQVMGWGRTGVDSYYPPSILQEVDIVAMSNEACNASYSAWEYALMGDVITPDMLCTFDFNKGACYGDSGSPVIIQGENYTEDVQVGIVSVPGGVNARVEEEFNWIRFQVCNLSDSPPKYFECDEPTENTWSPAPTTNAPSTSLSPSASPASTKNEVNVLIEIEMGHHHRH